MLNTPTLHFKAFFVSGFKSDIKPMIFAGIPWSLRKSQSALQFTEWNAFLRLTLAASILCWNSHRYFSVIWWQYIVSCRYSRRVLGLQLKQMVENACDVISHCLTLTAALFFNTLIVPVLVASNHFYIRTICSLLHSWEVATDCYQAATTECNLPSPMSSSALMSQILAPFPPLSLSTISLSLSERVGYCRLEVLPCVIVKGSQPNELCPSVSDTRQPSAVCLVFTWEEGLEQSFFSYQLAGEVSFALKLTLTSALTPDIHLSFPQESIINIEKLV